jgi:hypothetical protein
MSTAARHEMDVPFFPGSPPAGTVVLFGGQDPNLREWQSSDGSAARWRVVEGAMEVVPGTGDLVTLQNFTCGQLHLEFWIPELPRSVTGQDRGNSGIYLLGRYELQVLDSFAAHPSIESCGAIYGQHPPLRAACKPAGTWQTFDIFFHAPTLDTNGLIVAPARVTVCHNGLLIQNNTYLTHPTAGALDEYEALPGPLRLQDHGSRVRFRNIWILPDDVC